MLKNMISLTKGIARASSGERWQSTGLVRSTTSGSKHDEFLMQGVEGAEAWQDPCHARACDSAMTFSMQSSGIKMRERIM